MEGHKERGNVVKATSQENELCHGSLNGYRWGKVGVVKARKEEVVEERCGMTRAWMSDLAV